MNVRLLDDLWDPNGPRGAARAVSALLLPAEALFRAGLVLREAALRTGLLRVRRAPLPVVSVGGIEVGGTGKTPLALELARIAVRAGLQPAILSRGYGARSIGGRGGRGAVWKVPDPAPEDAAVRFGDEPVWLARRSAQFGALGVWVAPRRLLAAHAAAAAGADLAILDDGLQHRALYRDGEVVTLSGTAPLGNRRLLPVGPLREPPARALQRADVAVLGGVQAEEADSAAAQVRPFLRPGIPILSWHGAPSLVAQHGASPAVGEPVTLIAGIAHPERLPAALASLGHPVAEARLFEDHHRYAESDLRGLSETAPLVTTEKDWPRIRRVLSPSARVTLLVQSIRWNESGAEAGWREWLAGIVREWARRGGDRIVTPGFSAGEDPEEDATLARPATDARDDPPGRSIG